MSIPRSARANNPGNIRIGDNWQGLLPREEMTDEQKAEKSFCVFKSPEYGFRAMAICIRNPLLHGDTGTLVDVINRWAPPLENNSVAYVEDVSERSGIRSGATIDPDNFYQLFSLIRSMTIHETGSWEPWWNSAQLTEGLRMAGVREEGQS